MALVNIYGSPIELEEGHKQNTTLVSIKSLERHIFFSEFIVTLLFIHDGRGNLKTKHWASIADFEIICIRPFMVQNRGK